MSEYYFSIKVFTKHQFAWLCVFKQHAAFPVFNLLSLQLILSLKHKNKITCIRTLKICNFVYTLDNISLILNLFRPLKVCAGFTIPENKSIILCIQNKRLSLLWNFSVFTKSIPSDFKLVSRNPYKSVHKQNSHTHTHTHVIKAY